MINFYKFLESVDSNSVQTIAFMLSSRLPKALEIASLARSYANLHDEDAKEVLINLLFTHESYRAYPYVRIIKPVTVRVTRSKDHTYQPSSSSHVLQLHQNFVLSLDDQTIVMPDDDDQAITKEDVIKFIKDHFSPDRILQKYTKKSFSDFIADLADGNILNGPIKGLLTTFLNVQNFDEKQQYIEYLKHLASLDLDKMFIDYLENLIRSGEKEFFSVQSFLEKLMTNYELVGDL